MSGTHLVAGDYRWGKNPLRSFPSEYSPATSRWGYLSPATCRWGKARQFAKERGDCCSELNLRVCLDRKLRKLKSLETQVDSTKQNMVVQKEDRTRGAAGSGYEFRYVQATSVYLKEQEIVFE
ncbi:hypothetical protein Tco_0776716 [Tanacetum coccineum]